MQREGRVVGGDACCLLIFKKRCTTERAKWCCIADMLCHVVVYYNLHLICCGYVGAALASLSFCDLEEAICVVGFFVLLICYWLQRVALAEE